MNSKNHSLKRICVTGANGFIGKALVTYLLSSGCEVLAVARSERPFSGKPNLKTRTYDYLSGNGWNEINDFDAVVHCAGRAHVMNDKERDPLDAYREINTFWSLKVAEIAASRGVKRFVYLSSIKVNGEFTENQSVFDENLTQPPTDSYARSKYEAESELLLRSRFWKMDVCIIRLPLVYGPGVKANFNLLLRLVKIGVPLPFKKVKNSRSFLALDNLVDFIFLCADSCRSPNAANEVFLVSDQEDISTPQLVAKIATAYGIKSRLFSLPIIFLKTLFFLIGRSSGLSERLLESLKIDSSKSTRLLGWKPVVTMDQQLKKMSKESN